MSVVTTEMVQTGGKELLDHITKALALFVSITYVMPTLVRGLFGKLFGDKGYLSQPLVERLLTEQNVQLITPARRNMQGHLLTYLDACLLRKRAIIESIHDQLKNISQIDHSRHRCPLNFVVNLLAGLIAYSFQAKKPSLQLDSLLVPAFA